MYCFVTNWTVLYCIVIVSHIIVSYIYTLSYLITLHCIMLQRTIKHHWYHILLYHTDQACIRIYCTVLHYTACSCCTVQLHVGFYKKFLKMLIFFINGSSCFLSTICSLKLRKVWCLLTHLQFLLVVVVVSTLWWNIFSSLKVFVNLSVCFHFFVLHQRNQMLLFVFNNKEKVPGEVFVSHCFWTVSV